MGFRMRKSFKVIPGVRLTVSPSGLGVSAGVRGARYSVHSSGRRTKSVGIPGTGLGWVSSKTNGGHKPAQPSRPTPPASAKPGMFAPKGEKVLYQALREDRPALLEQVIAEYPDFSLLAQTVMGFQSDDDGLSRTLLSSVFETGKDPSLEPFFTTYIPNTSVTVEIAGGVTAVLPMNRDAVGLTLAELHQRDGYLPAAIDIVERIEPTSYAALSLAELYSESGNYDAVMELTEGIENEDDSTALLLVFRGIALRENGMNEGSLEAFKEALRFRSRPVEIRNLAMLERAATYGATNKKALARKDLERIMAADSNFPGAREALEELNS